MHRFVPGHRCGWFIAVIIMIAPLYALAQSDWNSLPPNIINKTALMKQHYGRLGFVVLDDTSRADCCEGPLWVVLGRTVVPQGMRLTIPEGTRVLFEPEASLVVDGTLVVRGAAGAPVEFMPVPLSERYMVLDSSNVAWAGITVGSNGKLDMRNSRVRDASRGIVSDGLCDSLVVNGVEFSGIDGTVFAYGDARPRVTLDSPFTNFCSPIASSRSQQSGKYLKVTSNALFATAAAAALTCAALYGAGYYTDQQVPTSSGPDEAQKLYDSASGLYRYGNVAAIVAGTGALAGLGFRIALTF